MVGHVPDGHIESIVEIMKKLSIDERDFARLCIIHYLYYL
jgi:hypothetical protein